MRYLSNLEPPPPEILDNFKHIRRRVEPWSYGHEVISDFEDKKGDKRFDNHRRCTFMTEDEAAILRATVRNVTFQIVLSSPVSGNFSPQAEMRRRLSWLDIGTHTGYSALAAASGFTLAGVANDQYTVYCLDSEFDWQEFDRRFIQNIFVGKKCEYSLTRCAGLHESKMYFASNRHGVGKLDGVTIDGNHDRPWPLVDAIGAAGMLRDQGAIFFHDAWGAPIQEAVEFLLTAGFRARLYCTPNGVIVCSRVEDEGGMKMPDIFPEHEPDPRIDWAAEVRKRVKPELISQLVVERLGL